MVPALLSFLLWCTLSQASHISVSGEPQAHGNPLEIVRVERTRLAISNSATLQVDHTTLSKSREWFEVSWSGITAPSFDDWIALWVPANAKFSETGPAKYKLAALSPTHLSHGSGSLRFKLINYRQDMVFAFVRGGFDNPLVVATSPVIKVLNPNEPLQGHLALTGKPSEMQVQWVTKDSPRPQVQWGTEPGVYPHQVEARSFSYSRKDMCGPPASTVGWVDPGTQHLAVMTGLEPGRRYYYVYGDKEYGMSSEYSFTQPHPAGAEVTVKFLAVADLGQAEDDGSMEQSEMMPSLNTTRLMAQEGDDYHLLVHNGDISYARGYVTQWDNFFHQMEPIISRMPYMTTPGNHERDYPGSGDRYGVYDSGGECGVAYERRNIMPLPGVDQPWYSFDLGPVHFLQYSTEHDFLPGSPQYKFLVNDLANVDRQLTPWVIVGGHRPFYINSNNRMIPDGDQPVASELRETYEAIFLKYKVDLTLHGHHHSYQRTCPVYQGRCLGYDSANGEALAPVHLVIGHGGAGLTPNVDRYPPKMWEVIKLWWGYARAEASATTLKVEVVNDEDGRLMDSLTLKKRKDWGKMYMSGALNQPVFSF